MSFTLKRYKCILPKLDKKDIRARRSRHCIEPKTKRCANSLSDMSGKYIRKRRTVYSKWQLEEMEKVFVSSHYPDTKSLIELSVRLCIPVDKLRNWFQNRRNRLKRRKSQYRHLPPTCYNKSSLVPCNRAEACTSESEMKTPAVHLQSDVLEVYSDTYSQPRMTSSMISQATKTNQTNAANVQWNKNISVQQPAPARNFCGNDPSLSLNNSRLLYNPQPNIVTPLSTYHYMPIYFTNYGLPMVATQSGNQLNESQIRGGENQSTAPHYYGSLANTLYQARLGAYYMQLQNTMNKIVESNQNTYHTLINVNMATSNPDTVGPYSYDNASTTLVQKSPDMATFGNCNTTPVGDTNTRSKTFHPGSITPIHSQHNSIGHEICRNPGSITPIYSQHDSIRHNICRNPGSITPIYSQHDSIRHNICRNPGSITPIYSQHDSIRHNICRNPGSITPIHGQHDSIGHDNIRNNNKEPSISPCRTPPIDFSYRHSSPYKTDHNSPRSPSFSSLDSAYNSLQSPVLSYTGDKKSTFERPQEFKTSNSPQISKSSPDYTRNPVMCSAEQLSPDDGFSSIPSNESMNHTDNADSESDDQSTSNYWSYGSSRILNFESYDGFNFMSSHHDEMYDINLTSRTPSNSYLCNMSGFGNEDFGMSNAKTSRPSQEYDLSRTGTCTSEINNQDCTRYGLMTSDLCRQNRSIFSTRTSTVSNQGSEAINSRTARVSPQNYLVISTGTSTVSNQDDAVASSRNVDKQDSGVLNKSSELYNWDGFGSRTFENRDNISYSSRTSGIRYQDSAMTDARNTRMGEIGALNRSSEISRQKCETFDHRTLNNQVYGDIKQRTSLIGNQDSAFGGASEVSSTHCDLFSARTSENRNMAVFDRSRFDGKETHVASVWGNRAGLDNHDISSSKRVEELDNHRSLATRKKLDCNQNSNEIQVRSRNDNQENITVRPATENGYRVSTTEDGYRVSTTEDGYNVSTTKDGYGISTTENGSRVSTTEDGYRMSTTKEGYRMSTTKDDYKVSTTGDGYRMSTTEDGYRVSTTEDGYRVSTTKDGYKMSTKY